MARPKGISARAIVRPRGRIGMLRRILAGFGGVAGAEALAQALAGLEARPVSARDVRDLMRGSGLRSLGAGYWALPSAPVLPVGRWVEIRLLRGGPEPVPALVQAVLETYPHGDAGAVRAWLAQDPGRVQVDRGIAWIPLGLKLLPATDASGG